MSSTSTDKMETTEDVELKKYLLSRTMKHPAKTAEKCIIKYYAIYYMQQELLKNIYVLPQKSLFTDIMFVFS